MNISKTTAAIIGEAEPVQHRDPNDLADDSRKYTPLWRAQPADALLFEVKIFENGRCIDHARVTQARAHAVQRILAQEA